MGFRSTN